MSGYGKENQCRNFAPNIFNKSKCQNCFKPRETHLLLDKDLNKATPIFVGWLLFAPIGTDFDNPTHRTRKWQRRYFILFEHGALRYALDDNANTLPQGTINMNQCTDVVHAEGMTGQKYSLCIYLPEMKYFIRSESRDDTQSWYDQLIVFPQTIKQEALIKRKFSRRIGNTKDTTAPTNDSNKRSSPVTYDALRSPKPDTVPPEKFLTTEPHDKKPGTDIKRGRSISRKSTDKKQGTQTPDVQRPIRRAKSLDRDSHNLNDITIESSSVRRGWVLKRTNTPKETWTKHWFVLGGNSLKYYKDPTSEEFSQPDGEISLDDVIRVNEVVLGENYGFAVHTVGEEVTLATVTSGLRKNWIQAIEKSSKAINEKENTEKGDPEKVPMNFDEAMVERSMEKRARMRQRRKAGRARTYDFSELKSAKSANSSAPDRPSKINDAESIKAVFGEPTEVAPLIMNNSVTARNEENGLDVHDGSKKEKLKSPRSPRQARTDSAKKLKLSLTPKLVNLSQWDEIEKTGAFSRILPNNQQDLDKSAMLAACNSLKSEVEFMAKQFEMGKKEFGDTLKEQNEKMEISEKEEVLRGGGNNKVSVDDGSMDRLRNLEISHKCAIEENKRLREEVIQSRMTREQETNRLNSKIRDLKTQLAMIEKRSKIKSKFKSDKSDRSLKDKMSELEAQMEDTGQMIDRRLTALETPRRKEADDSDEAGSSSSCSSINQMMRLGKGEEVETKKVNFETMHQKLTDSIKSLQDARQSHDHGTSAMQEAFHANKKLVSILQNKLLEDQKSWLAVKRQLQELQAKITEIKSGKVMTDTQHVLPYLDSELNNVLQIIDKGQVFDVSSKVKGPDLKEIEKNAVTKLKNLSENYKVNDLPSYSLSAPSSLTPSINVLDGQKPETIPFDQKEQLFAQQLSHEAMIIAEMAGTLERFANAKNADPSSSLLHSDSQDIFPENQKAINKSTLLQHAGIVAEKILLQSRLVLELSMLQAPSNLPNVRHEFKSASLPQSVSYKPGQGGFSGHQGMVEGSVGLSLVQAQVNYLLHVYNDRIARLSQDVREAQHRADSFQQKLVELVHACKTKDIEVVSQIALEVDTKASLFSTVEDLPEWRQQVDYGMLHGAEASISTIDLQVEASFFAKLAEDISRMSSDVGSLSNVGSRILEIDMSLSKLLKPSVIGEHASVIAYEAISQAQLLFLIRRISKDYEEQISKMKNSTRQQAAQCELLQQKLKELESGDAVKMQQLTTEHQQNVERLEQQLSLVEKARKEMSTEMDQKLNKLAKMQKQDLERIETQHKKEIERLKSELKDCKAQEHYLEKQHEKKVSELERRIAEMEEQHELEIVKMKENAEKSIEKERRNMRKIMDNVSSDEAQKIERMKDEFRKELESVILANDKKIQKLEDDKLAELSIMTETHRRDMENERYKYERELDEMKKEFNEALREKEEMLESMQLEMTKESKHNVEIDELQNFFERRFSNFEQTHKKQLEDMAKSYQLEVKRLEEEKSREMDENTISTKLAIESMKKYYSKEVEKMRENSGDSSGLQEHVDKLTKDFEALSEMYSKKCAEISSKEENLKSLQSKLIVAEENNEVLKEQNEKLSSKIKNELGEMKRSNSFAKKNEEDSDDVHHLRVELGAKKLEVSILQQQMASLKQQVAMTLQGRVLHGYELISHDDLSSKKGVVRSSSERRAVAKVTIDD